MIRKLFFPVFFALIFSLTSGCYLIAHWGEEEYGSSSSKSQGSSSSSSIAVTYTVSFDSQGATTAANPASITVIPPAAIITAFPTVPSKTGFYFAGWYTASNGEGTLFTTSTPVTSNITVYAYWSSNTVYTVTYNSDGGSLVGLQYVTLPATTVGKNPTAPSRTGYNFAGWYTAPNGGGKQLTAGTPVTADITVYASWKDTGSSWTNYSTLPSSAAWNSVTYGNGIFVAISRSGGNIAAASPDGITWTPGTLPSSGLWNSVAYGNGVFVAVVQSSSNAATSTDGIHWTAQTLPVSAGWTVLTYGNGKFVAVAESKSASAASSDGINWTAGTLPTSTAWSSVAYGNGVFVAVTKTTATAATSPDGIHWTAWNLPAAGFYSVAYGNGVFVSVASGTKIAAVSQ